MSVYSAKTIALESSATRLVSASTSAISRRIASDFACGTAPTQRCCGHSAALLNLGVRVECLPAMPYPIDARGCPELFGSFWGLLLGVEPRQVDFELTVVRHIAATAVLASGAAWRSRALDTAGVVDSSLGRKCVVCVVSVRDRMLMNGAVDLPSPRPAETSRCQLI